jgi:hypothetical protein
LNTPPPDLPVETIRAALQHSWDIEPSTLDYAALGFGSHHWIATDDAQRRWFVTVDELDMKPWLADDVDAAFDALARCYAIPARLVDGGLAFVRAPITATDGTIVERISARHAICVQRWLDGRGHNWGDFDSDSERDGALACLAELHDSTDAVRDLACIETFDIPAREHLDAVLDARAAVWADGPLTEPARAAITENAVELRHALDAYDDLVRNAGRDGWVITHGEPHAANWVITTASPVLIDWDTPLLAPRERDLARVIGGDIDDAGPYLDATGVDLNPDLLLLYLLWWDLKDVACYVDVLRQPHHDTADTRKMLLGLERSSRFSESFPGLLD